MTRWLWMERKFQFDYPPSKFPDLLERWRGTPARLEDRLRDVPDEIGGRSDGRGWTIKQNVGHLIDLDYLPTQRLEEILAGASELIAADMTNQATQQANHNQRSITELLAEFRKRRMEAVARFETLTERDWGKAGMHPRLKQLMRIVDIPYFDSEHDDYHLGRVGELLRAFGL